MIPPIRPSSRWDGRKTLIHHSETFLTSPGGHVYHVHGCAAHFPFWCLEHQICKSGNESFFETNIPPSTMYSFRIVWKKGFLAITVHHGALCRSMLWKYNRECFHVALDSRARAHCDFMFAALFFTVSISHQIASNLATRSSMATYLQIAGPCCVRPDASFVFSHLPASACGPHRNGFIKCFTQTPQQSRLDFCSLGCDTLLHPLNGAEEFITNLLQERRRQKEAALSIVSFRGIHQCISLRCPGSQLNVHHTLYWCQVIWFW